MLSPLIYLRARVCVCVCVCVRACVCVFADTEKHSSDNLIDELLEDSITHAIDIERRLIYMIVK